MAGLVSATIDWKTIAAGGVVVAGLYFLLKSEAKAGAAAAGTAVKAVGGLVNPTAQDNLADRAADGLTESLTMRENDSFGKFLWRQFHTDAEVAALDAAMRKPYN